MYIFKSGTIQKWKLSGCLVDWSVSVVSFVHRRMAYAVYDSEEVLEEVIKAFADKQPEIEGKLLRVYKYQPSAEMPAGITIEF